ncbi:flavoprotein, partial [Fusobacterium polymorphum]
MELEKIIEYIVQEVIKKINSQNLIEDCSPKEKILVAINGSTNNLEQVILELKRISKNYDLSLVFSETASNIIDENLFSEFHIIRDFSIKNYDEILSKHNIIL